MKRSIIAACMLAPALVMVSCAGSKKSGSKKLAGVWQAQHITIDGNNKDWPSPYPQYDDKAMLGYAVSNDKDNLYITVETGDQATQLKILRGGLTVWIDKTGNKEQTMAINYPIPASASNNSSTGESETPRPKSGNQWQQGNGEKTRINMEDRIKRALDEAKEYSLQGFKSCNQQYNIIEKDTCGITVRIGLDEYNELVWEAVIPFKAFYSRSQIDKRDKGKPMSVCFETTGQKRPASQGSGMHNGGGGGGMRPGISMGGGGMGMGMHGGGGRGMRGGGSHNNPGNTALEPLYKSTTTWKKFGIAWQE